jgi:hypothetical protein
MLAAAETAWEPLRYARHIDGRIATDPTAAVVDIGRAPALGVCARRTAYLVAPVLSAYCELFPGGNQVGIFEDTET